MSTYPCDDRLIIKKIMMHNAYIVTPMYSQIFIENKLYVTIENYDINLYITNNDRCSSVNKTANALFFSRIIADATAVIIGIFKHSKFRRYANKKELVLTYNYYDQLQRTEIYSVLELIYDETRRRSVKLSEMLIKLGELMDQANETDTIYNLSVAHEPNNLKKHKKLMKKYFKFALESEQLNEQIDHSAHVMHYIKRFYIIEIIRLISCAHMKDTNLKLFAQ